MKTASRFCKFIMGAALLMAILGPRITTEPFQLDFYGFAWLMYFIAGGFYLVFGVD